MTNDQERFLQNVKAHMPPPLPLSPLHKYAGQALAGLSIVGLVLFIGYHSGDHKSDIKKAVSPQPRHSTEPAFGADFRTGISGVPCENLYGPRFHKYIYSDVCKAD
jgi:hypothetical protein